MSLMVFVFNFNRSACQQFLNAVVLHVADSDRLIGIGQTFTAVLNNAKRGGAGSSYNTSSDSNGIPHLRSL